MIWNWQQKNWPQFTYDFEALKDYERLFLLRSGEFFGVFKHLDSLEKNNLIIDLISDEAVKTSEIEGELLDRTSVQSSIKVHFGLQESKLKSSLAEQGIADLMVDLYQTFKEPLRQDTLFRWNKMILKGSQNIVEMGTYRTHLDPMQVISGSLQKRKVHFEAPPSKQVPAEMKAFIKWFCTSQIPGLTKAGIAHLYFVSIHPFEDGNGRLARALSEKVLAQYLGQPSMIGLSQAIQKKRKKYYDSLEQANKNNEITDWLVYFSQTLLEAQALSEASISLILAKTKFFDKFEKDLNLRQKKVLLKMFKAGPEGYIGGLSADKYISITKTSRATATRDLQNLVEMGALTRTGELKHTRYELRLLDY